ncbi:MAG: anhydro-N-acetylmuramic acid kinase [Chitinophagales bacterium]
MQYRVIGLMSGSSLDGLDMVFVHFQENSGKWVYEIQQTACYPYSTEWSNKLKNAPALSAYDYQLLHTEYGHYLGAQVNRFIEENDLQFQVQLISSHGHTVFHLPAKKMTAQLGDGAAIASSTGINTISDLRSVDLALGGQGAPIVPIGEKLLLEPYRFFLNLGGIANLTARVSMEKSKTAGSGSVEHFIAFDVCPANRILNLLALDAGKTFDEDGYMASTGYLDANLLSRLNQFPYYEYPYPKSLGNEFGNDELYPMIRQASGSIQDKLRTAVEHIAIQVRDSVEEVLKNAEPSEKEMRMLVTGGGAHNKFMISRLSELTRRIGVELLIADPKLADYKEALIMAFIGVLRWREETNVLSSVTGASRDSIGGAVWMGQEA